MKNERLLFIMGNLSDDILEETEYVLFKGRTDLSRHGYSRRRKLCTLLFAILIVLLSTLAAAVTIDDGFRDALFSFLHIARPESILPANEEPHLVSDVETIHSERFEDAVFVDYIRVDGDFDDGDGMICHYNNEERTDVTLYGVRDGVLIPLDTETAELTLSWESREYAVSFVWGVFDGHLCVYGKHKEPACDEEAWSVSALPDGTDLVCITLSDGRGKEYREKPYLYRVSDGEVMDLIGDFASTVSVIHTTFSSDLAWMICADADGSLWIGDRTVSRFQPAEELLGHPIDGCWFADSEHIVYYTRNEEARYTYTLRSLLTGEERRIIENVPRHGSASAWGIKAFNGRYGLFVSEDGTIAVLDYITGEQSRVEQYSYPRDCNTRILPNGDGSKLLFISSRKGSAMELNKNDQGLEINQVGVMDLQDHSFTLLDRVGSSVRYENAVGWFDNDRVRIRAEANGYGYLYLYTFAHTTS